MIGAPLNDYQCLGEITSIVSELAEREEPVVADVAHRFTTTADLAAWIRGLPQRNDDGEASDGPRVDDCEPTQRLRIPAEDPNCVERAALYLAAAELLDPRHVRQLATINTSVGPHTIALEDGVPVILDPRVTRNAMEAGLFELEPGPVRMRPSEAIAWLGAIAEEPASSFERGRARVRNGCDALGGVLYGRPVTVAQARDVGLLLSLAEREAQQFGPRGVALARCAVTAVSELDQLHRQHQTRNAPSIRIGRRRIEPNLPLLGSLGRVAGRLGVRAGSVALRVKLASMGITGPMLGEVERELNREGLTLGEVAKPPPMLGSLAAVTPTAMAGHWLANKS